jgi:hypothetical protein
MGLEFDPYDEPASMVVVYFTGAERMFQAQLGGTQSGRGLNGADNDKKLYRDR